MTLSRYVSVCFQSKSNPNEFSGREYTYMDGVGLMLNDLVIAPTAKGESVAKVVRIVREDEIDRKILPLLKTIHSLYMEEKEVVENA